MLAPRHGIIQVQGGTFEVQSQSAMKGLDSGGHDLAYIQTGGEVAINGTFETSNAGLQGGTLGGSGMIAGNLAASGGVLSPGSSPGTLTVSNDFALSGSGTLLIELAGRGTSGFDQLKVGGTAQLGGTLAVALLSGFAPAPGDQFQILTCSNRVGTFSTVQMPAGLALNYSSTNVVLVVTGTVPAQITAPAVASGNFVFSFGTLSNQSYTIERNDDVAGTKWVFMTNLTGTGALWQFVTPITNAPQRFFRVRQP